MAMIGVFSGFGRHKRRGGKQQKKFARAAKACRGTGKRFHSCMKKELK